MKTCPLCGATYSARISFCFEDGCVLVASAAGEQALNAPPARHVPSRVATPVAPARRGRSLLAQKGGGLTFSPPKATATPHAALNRGPDPSPAPLQPLELPLSEHDDLLAGLPIPTLDAPRKADATPPPPGPPAATPPAPGRNTPVPAPAGRNSADEIDARTFDDLDFHEVAGEAGPDLGVPEGVAHDDERPPEDRGGIPLWWFAIGGAVVVVLGLLVVFIGGAAGLLGTGALMRGGEVAVVEPAPVPVPVAVAEPVPAPVPVPVAEPVAPVAPPAPEPIAVVDVAPPVPAPAPAPAPVRPAPAPAPAPGDASPWGTLEVQESQVNVTSLPVGAKLTVDGDIRGLTPSKFDLPYGEHTFALTLDGYGNVEKIVKVDSPKQTVALEMQALSRTASFIIVLEGSVGAMLYVDGVKVGPLPARVTLSEGAHEFTVESPSGTYTINRDVTMASGSNVINLAG